MRLPVYMEIRKILCSRSKANNVLTLQFSLYQKAKPGTCKERPVLLFDLQRLFFQRTGQFTDIRESFASGHYIMLPFGKPMLNAYNNFFSVIASG